VTDIALVLAVVLVLVCAVLLLGLQIRRRRRRRGAAESAIESIEPDLVSPESGVAVGRNEQ
jgi:Na+-transporting methylmalonyl-CoA/oxaloacetate decarboxylase gamma subunit